MNDKQLKSFISAADHKSFSKAAAESFISTPALINQINLLERDLDLQLFHRTSQGITLTEEGEIFYDTANNILKMYAEAMTKAKMLHDHASGQILLAGGNHNFTSDFKLFCMQYTQEHPEVSVVSTDTDFHKRAELLQTQEIGIVCDSEYAEDYTKNLCFLPLYTDIFCIVMLQSHPLASRTSLTPADLADYEIICERDSCEKTNIGLFLQQAGVAIQWADLYSNGTTYFNSMLNNQLLALPDRWAQTNPELTVAIPIEGTQHNVGLYYHKKCPGYIKTFLAAYRQHLADRR